MHTHAYVTHSDFSPCSHGFSAVMDEYIRDMLHTTLITMVAKVTPGTFVSLVVKVTIVTRQSVLVLVTMVAVVTKVTQQA